MKHKRAAGCLMLLISLVCFSLSSCTGSAPVKSDFFSMDTHMSVSLFGQNAQQIADKIEEEAKTLDSLLSVTDEQSDIYKINHAHGDAIAVSEKTLSLIEEAKALCELLDGYLDISLYPVSYVWGFTTDNYRIPDREEISDLLQSVGYREIESDASRGAVKVKDNMMLDLGALAKGYLADRAKTLLSEDSKTSGILNFGGTILPFGKKNGTQLWKVGVADPENSSACFGVLSLWDTVVSTSGGYERYFIGEDGRRYIHIIDPTTGCPADNGVLSVTVVCDSGTSADALSTALFVMGTDQAHRFYREHPELSFDYLMLTDDGSVYVTEGIAECFSLSEGYDYTVRVLR